MRVIAKKLRYRVQYQEEEEAVSSEINISFHFFVFDVAFLAVWDSNHACVRSDTFARLQQFESCFREAL